MTKAIGLGLALWIVTTLGASLVQAQPAGEGSGKGTIGMVCIDSRGDAHLWNADAQGEFTTCIDEVVSKWTSEENSSGSAKRPSSEDRIEGMQIYRDSVVRHTTSSMAQPSDNVCRE
jgi:hypothetical protein